MNDILESKSYDTANLITDPLTIALAVVIDRIRSLDPDDREDLFELVQGLPGAESEEDQDSIYLSLREILARRPLRSQPIDQISEATPGPKLRNWIDFVSAKVRDARESASLTQVELAERTGLPQSHISRIENGKLSPSRHTLEKIAKGLDLPISALDPTG